MGCPFIRLQEQCDRFPCAERGSGAGEDGGRATETGGDGKADEPVGVGPSGEIVGPSWSPSQWGSAQRVSFLATGFSMMFHHKGWKS
jgi:hypothetical protein